MNTPGFSAGACLEARSNEWRPRQKAPSKQRDEPQKTVLIPQRGDGGYKGLAGCLDDCADLRPNWTAGQCRKICKDHAGIPGSGGGQKRDWASKVLCDWIAGICALTTGDGFLESLCFASFITGYDGPCNCGEQRIECLRH